MTTDTMRAAVGAMDEVVLSKLPPPLYIHPKLGEMFDRFQMHQYAMKYLMECEAATRPIAADTQGDAKDAAPKLVVWFGPMPESNGKTNWTAILHRAGGFNEFAEGITLARSEYHDRVRYEADRARHLIGGLAEAPDILAYDSNMLSPSLNEGKGKEDHDVR